MLHLAAGKLSTIGLNINSEYTVLYISKLTKACVTIGKGCRSYNSRKSPTKMY